MFPGETVAGDALAKVTLKAACAGVGFANAAKTKKQE
jgi:hypothetical protein